MPFEVRWGSRATSSKMPAPPPEGMIQVNTANDNTRVVFHVRRAPFPLSKMPDFVAAAPQSTTQGVNANPQKAGYVFGAGESGDGYYGFGTAHGDEIMRLRLEALLAQHKACAACCFCFPCSAKEIAELEAILASGDFYAVPKARRTQAGGACAERVGYDPKVTTELARCVARDAFAWMGVF